MKRSISILLTIAVLLFLSVGILADGKQTYVYDFAGILSEQDVADLEAEAARISEAGQCDVCIIVIENYREFASDTRQAAITLYETYDLGFGEEKDGVLLMLSMKERDYYLLAHGFGETAFTDYGMEWLSERFLDPFGDNEWKKGFSVYLSESEDLIAMARDGDPFGFISYEDDELYDDSGIWLTTNDIFGIMVALVLGAVVALIVCQILKGKMKSVAKKTEAANYIPKNGVRITYRNDRYLRTTVTRHRIERSSSGGHSSGGGRSSGGGGGGGGYSGRGGKF